MIARHGNSISHYREFVSSNPIRQTWQFLHMFHDLDYVERSIAAKFGLDNKQHKKFIHKQAQQLSYCLKQAEEYFQAASQISVATKPLLLYYGAVCLARALILFKNSGEYSLDYLRKHKKHNHHGLQLSRLMDHPNGLLTLNYCKVYFKEDGTAWGTFPLFYSSLVPPAVSIDTIIYEENKNGYVTLKTPGYSRLPDLNTYKNVDFQLLTLLLQCPDMIDSIRYFWGSVASPLYKVRVETTTEFKEDTEDFELTVIYYVNGVYTEEEHKLMLEDGSEFIEERSDIKIYRKIYPVKADEVSEDSVHDEKFHLIDDLNGQLYIQIPTSFWGVRAPEPAAMYMLIFTFGWLVRYYPDIWLKGMEDITYRETIEKFTEIFERKFPLLILDQLTLTKHYIHS